MMVGIGNFLFHYRNALFPVMYLLLFLESASVVEDYRLAAVAGFAAALTGQVVRAATIGLEYIVRGGRNRQVYAENLVQGGIFAHCRNPLYVGNFIILLGVGLAANSVLFLGVALPFFAFAYWAIIAAEENYLRRKFGQEFEEYCRRVNRFVPRLAGLGRTLTGMRFNWRRLVEAEYGSTYIWLAAIILVTLKKLWLGGHDASGHAVVWGLCVVFMLGSVCDAFGRYLKKSGSLAREPVKNEGRLSANQAAVGIRPADQEPAE
jgi:protein-S-isoprenylcysteine O-methyltransferase Ste14